jgi:hypothetical protein
MAQALMLHIRSSCAASHCAVAAVADTAAAGRWGHAAVNATSHSAVADIFAAGSWGYAAAQSAVAAVGSLEIAQAWMIQNVE